MLNQSFLDFIDKISHRLTQPLPGAAAHEKLLSSNYKQRVLPNDSTRQGAILILFFPYREEVYCPMIVRSKYEGVHSGQIAFPGGRYENFDESLIRTALREAQEEIGIYARDVKVLGTLSEIYIQASNIRVLPVIGTIPYRPAYYPDEREVEEVFEMSISELKKRSHIQHTEVQVGSKLVQAPYFGIEGKVVWGATAMMLSELLEIIEL